jgi:hypothetical protein
MHVQTLAEATPKTIMRLMGIPGLTLYHLKSHLQVRTCVHLDQILLLLSEYGMVWHGKQILASRRHKLR